MNPRIQQRIAPQTELPDDLHPVLKRIYAARGVQSPVELELGLDRLLPFDQLKGIDAAVDLLIASLRTQQKILIVGDYDADGATSTALFMRMLPCFGFERVGYLLPNRFEYGYGLSPEIVEVAKQQQPDLIITVDNGIASIAGVAAAREAGIDVLITDHHLPGKQLPDANVIVNPNQPDDSFPSKMLAGVGVVFYILMALRKQLRDAGWFEAKNLPEPNLAGLLDIVALGTVADVVPLDHNNRILVEQGLRRMRAGKCQPGVLALIQQAGKDCAFLKASDLGFSIAPRLNAAGRLDDMSIGVECLLTDDPERARQLAVELDRMNLQRRQISQDMQAEADRMLEALALPDNTENTLPNVYCLHQDHWHQGVVGILAGRIKDKMHRPVIIFANTQDGNGTNASQRGAEIKGSARSIAGFHIRDALDAVAGENPGLITKFGGHAMAAGLSICHADLPIFTQKLNDYAGRVLSKDQLQETILTDGELGSADLDESLAKALELAGPWGQGFAAPLFEGRFNVVQRRRIGADQRHLKLLLECGGTKIDAVAFSVPDTAWPPEREVVEIVYRLEMNRFRGEESLQLLVEHVLSEP